MMLSTEKSPIAYEFIFLHAKQNGKQQEKYSF